LVEPEAAVVGPLRLTVGGVPVLWHEVQVDPVFPEKPVMPLPEALAGIDEEMIASVTRMTETQEKRDPTDFFSRSVRIDNADARGVKANGDRAFL
jgi:hypothetical protein